MDGEYPFCCKGYVCFHYLAQILAFDYPQHQIDQNRTIPIPAMVCLSNSQDFVFIWGLCLTAVVSLSSLCVSERCLFCQGIALLSQTECQQGSHLLLYDYWELWVIDSSP